MENIDFETIKNGQQRFLGKIPYDLEVLTKTPTGHIISNGYSSSFRIDLDRNLKPIYVISYEEDEEESEMGSLTDEQKELWLKINIFPKFMKLGKECFNQNAEYATIVFLTQGRLIEEKNYKNMDDIDKLMEDPEYYPSEMNDWFMEIYTINFENLTTSLKSFKMIFENKRVAGYTEFITDNNVNKKLNVTIHTKLIDCTIRGYKNID